MCMLLAQLDADLFGHCSVFMVDSEGTLTQTNAAFNEVCSQMRAPHARPLDSRCTRSAATATAP